MIEALRGANSAVLEASQDSALVYARMLDVAAQKYSTPDHPICIRAARDLAARIQIGGTVRGYGQHMCQEEKLAWDEKEWAKTLRNIEDRKSPSRPVRVMHTPLVMQMVGVKNLPVYMDISKIQRIKKDHPEMTSEVLKQLPRALTNPVMIFRSETHPERVVSVLAIKGGNGANIDVPFVLNVERHHIHMNMIASAYSKGDRGTNFGWMQEQVRNGNLLYADRSRAADALGTNKEKTAALLKSAGVQFPMEVNKHNGSLIQKIPDEEDLVKYKNARPSYYQMAGERAETAPLARLEEAKAMQASGESEDAIWQKTGWMMGKDGKWRWEIPDNLDGIDVSAVRSMKEGDATVLSLIYDNDALYEAYPWLANVFVRAGDLGEKIYGAAREGNRIYINTKSEDAEIKNTLIHEIQHIIQYYEGFAIGGNPASLAGGYREYRNLAGEQEARNTADRAAAVNNAVKAERKAWKKVIDMRSQLEKNANRLDDESKKKILELADTKIDIREKKEIPGDEVLDRIDELEAWMKETAPQSVKDAYEAFDDALWDHGGAVNEREWQEKEIPLVHDEDAIVVFGGESMPCSMAGNMTYYQKAWHGSGARFDRFDLGYLFSGEGEIAHGWGLYFAKNKKTAQKYKKAMEEKGIAPTLYKAEIPENKELLDEQKLFRDQDQIVQEALANAIGALPDKEKRIFWEEMAGRTLSRTAEKIGGKAKELENLKWQLQHLGENTRRKGIFARARDRLFRNAGYTEEDLQRIKDDPEEAKKEVEKIDKKILGAKRKEEEERKTAEEKDREINQKLINNLARDPQAALNRSGYPGGSVYAKLAKALGGNIPDCKAASLYLNQYGIKGITYEDMTDGRYFVVFDDKAVAIIDRFNQEATYGQPMFDVSGRGIKTLSAFRKRIEEGDATGEKVNSKKMTDPHGVGIHGRTAPPYHQRTSSDRRRAGRYRRTYQRSV